MSRKGQVYVLIIIYLICQKTGWVAPKGKACTGVLPVTYNAKTTIHVRSTKATKEKIYTEQLLK